MSGTKQDNTKRILDGMSDEDYNQTLIYLAGIPSFQAAESYALPEEARAVMTEEAATKLAEFFDILKLDYKNDENLKDTPFRVASMYINELMVGRYTNPPRIEAFPADMYIGKATSNSKYVQAHKIIMSQLQDIETELYKPDSLKTNELLMNSEALLGELDRLKDECGITKPDIQTVVAKTIDVNSLCSHHLISFVSTDDKDSKCTITYIPTLGSEKALLGISKLQRVADWFGRRPQLQEELNWQIKAFVSLILRSSDVMVSFNNIIHYCEKTRGVESHCGSTSSAVFSGRFKDPENRKLAHELTRN